MEHIIYDNKGQVILGGNGDLISVVTQAAHERRKSFSDADLSGMNLQGVRLPGMDLTGVNFRNSDLSFGDISGSHISAWNCEGARFYKTDVDYVKVRGSPLREGLLDFPLHINLIAGPMTFGSDYIKVGFMEYTPEELRKSTSLEYDLRTFLFSMWESNKTLQEKHGNYRTCVNR